MGALVSQIYNFYTDVGDFLYWEVYDEIYDLFLEGFIAPMIANLIFMGAIIALAAFVLVKMDEWQDVKAETPVAHTSPWMCPVTPSPPRLAPLIPAIYPPPYDFPFEHFRGTGDSFAPSRQNFHIERPRYIPPVFYKSSNFLETIEDVQRPDEGIPAVAEDAAPTGTIKAVLAGTQESAEPLHEEVEESQLCSDTFSPPLKENRLSSLPEMASTKAPSEIPPQTPLQIQRLPEALSPEMIRLNALNQVAQEEYKIQEQMVVFLDMIPTGSGYELSASLILDLLCEAKEYLEPLFPDGLSGIPTGYLVWGKSIIDFWDTLSPYGWDFLHHPDSRVPEFIRRYRNLAIWFGLEDMLSEFLFVPPFVPEPIHEPVPEPFSEPVMTVTEAWPQLQEQTRVAQVPSFDEPPQPQEEQPAPQPDPTPATFTYTMSQVPAKFSYQKPSHKSDLAPKPPSTLPPGDAAPATLARETVQTPQREQSPTPPSPAPLSFTYTLPSTPVNPSYRRSNRTSKPPRPRSSRPTQSPQKQPAEPSKPTTLNPNLIDFNDPKWSNKPTPELTVLTWSSFSFLSPSAAALKIWSHSTMGRLALPEPRTKDLTSEYIKSHFEAVALDFKRASAILRLQALNCDKPCEDDLGMSPLFGEVMSLMVQAADFTERCDELCVWDARDNWYHACVFFRDAVVEDKKVWDALCGYYGQEKFRPLINAWKQGSVEWLLLDADYPDVQV
ncbi:hypothetical protein J3E73DRAFT_254714 [Bipolaris maydis]|nr:hypothetical protein J3E73DRAFT_254714 [Bipolaris maydis]